MIDDLMFLVFIFPFRFSLDSYFIVDLFISYKI